MPVISITVLSDAVTVVHVPVHLSSRYSTKLYWTIDRAAQVTPEFFNVTSNRIEMAIFASVDLIGEEWSVADEGVKINPNWRVFEITSGDEDDGDAGNYDSPHLRHVSAPLAKEGISILYQSSYFTDFLLVKEEDFERTSRIFASQGWHIDPTSTAYRRRSQLLTPVSPSQPFIPSPCPSPPLTSPPPQPEITCLPSPIVCIGIGKATEGRSEERIRKFIVWPERVAHSSDATCVESSDPQTLTPEPELSPRTERPFFSYTRTEDGASLLTETAILKSLFSTVAGGPWEEAIDLQSGGELTWESEDDEYETDIEDVMQIDLGPLINSMAIQWKNGGRKKKGGMKRCLQLDLRGMEDLHQTYHLAVATSEYQNAVFIYVPHRQRTGRFQGREAGKNAVGAEAEIGRQGFGLTFPCISGGTLFDVGPTPRNLFLMPPNSLPHTRKSSTNTGRAMSSIEASIDPSLRELPVPPRKLPRQTSAKRKAKEPILTRTTSSRVTRRTQAVASEELAEPTRGEEENLIGYEWSRPGDAKRSRHHSPAAGSIPNVYAPIASSDFLPHWTDGVQGATSVQTTNLDVTGMKGLAAAAVAFQAENTNVAPPRRLYPYPYGITPFRYPCLHPSQPAPPPGDPTDPKFTPFDPTAIMGQANPTTSNIPATEIGPNDVFPAYQSISSLFDVSQMSFPAAYPSSPGERSDGESGPLNDKLIGRYSMASKLDCMDCQTGKDGHWGHWMKNATGYGV
ncbi:hypothetical protein P7C73_g1819, partial [Tremellales sp. Uapishka_1]